MDVLRDRNFVMYIAGRLVQQVSLFAVPFYTLYAKTQLGAPTSMVATYTAVVTTASMLSAMGWGWICDRQGNRQVMLWVAILTVVMTLWPLLVGARVSYTAYSFLYVLLGLVQGGTMLVRMTFVMDLAPANARAVYAGVVNTASGVVSLLSVAAGWVVQEVGPEVLFAVSAVFALAAPFLTWMIREPRVADRSAPAA
jgi:MFS family permease